jgi:hypothetical protein
MKPANLILILILIVATLALGNATASQAEEPSTPAVGGGLAPRNPISFTGEDVSAVGHGNEPAHSHPIIGEPDEHDFVLLPPALGPNPVDGWFDKWPHTHHSRRGTPFVHLFANEPAFMDRDFFLDFAVADGDEGFEFEIEAELEYTLTRRIGVVIEAPYTYLDPVDGESEDGFGDLAIAPRFLLLDSDRFLVAGNVELEFPTGDEDRGLGAGEIIVAPSFSTWLDLGNRFTLQNNVGVELGADSHSEVLVWGGALTYSLYTQGSPDMIREDGAVRSHFPTGLLNLIAEIRGELPLDGEDEGIDTAAWILGASYSLSPHLELRCALTLPAWNPREFDNGAIFGVIYHF